MNVKLAMQLLLQSTVEMIHYAIADNGITLSLNNNVTISTHGYLLVVT